VIISLKTIHHFVFVTEYSVDAQLYLWFSSTLKIKLKLYHIERFIFSNREHCFQEKDKLVDFHREIVVFGVLLESHQIHCGENSELYNVKCGGTCSNH
jgi:hypothetical protein